MTLDQLFDKKSRLDGSEILHQLKLVVYHIIYKDLYIQGGAGFLPSTVIPTFSLPLTGLLRWWCGSMEPRWGTFGVLDATVWEVGYLNNALFEKRYLPKPIYFGIDRHSLRGRICVWVPASLVDAGWWVWWVPGWHCMFRFWDFNFNLQFLLALLPHPKVGYYCWWFRNPANQLRLVVSFPLFTVFFDIPSGAGFLPSTVR